MGKNFFSLSCCIVLYCIACSISINKIKCLCEQKLAFFIQIIHTPFSKQVSAYLGSPSVVLENLKNDSFIQA